MNTNIDRNSHTGRAQSRRRGTSLFMPSLALAGICILQLIACPAAFATTACIADAAGLTAALNYLTTHNQVTTINLEENTYDLGALDLTFLAPIQIVGGFKPGTLCATHEENANKTIIDFGGANVSLSQERGSPNALIAFSDLTLRDGGAFDIYTGASATPPLLGQHAHSGQITMNHVRVTQFAYLMLGTYYGGVRLTDALFDHLYPGGSCAIETVPFDTSTYVFDHVTMDLTGGKDLCLGDTGYDDARNYTIANSIIWASDGTLSAVNGLNDQYDQNGDNNNVTIDHTLFKGYLGAGTVTIHNQISSDPLWVNPAGGDYRLKYPPQTLSPAINAGTTVAGVYEPFTDINGAPRAIGSHTDLGAYESLYNDSSSFTVTNATDCSAPYCGSLRDAINLATASAAATATISFDIAGGCPAVINLSSPLPDVTKPITIDGYSQPDSAVNTDQIAFNAKLCVVVQPVNGTYYALRVPANSNGSLTLRGIGIGSFPVAVELFGGSDHQIAGNQFGGYIDNYTFQLYGSIGDAIYMGAPNGQVSIGGPDRASRNVFLNVFSYTALPAAAVNVGSAVNGAYGACQIVGNTFGVQDDGTFASKNLDYGIYLQGSNCFVSDNIIVGVNKDAIFIDGGSGGGNNNVVQNNTIGLAPRGNLSGTNSGAGIRISGVHNVVGSSTALGASLSVANVIQNMDGGGVIVTGQNAYGNTIRANYIQDNGPSHDGLSIDLGGDGPTINDVCDCDTGANDSQNFPTLHSISWPATPNAGTNNQPVVVSGLLRTFPGYYYQVDVYYSDGCDAYGKGIAQQWIGSNEFIGLPAQVYLVPFQVEVEIPVYVPGYGALSATATNNINGEGSTSEMSTCFPIDTIFRDGHEGGIGFD
jgi:hypothetical protein